ncbi:DNA-binding transcriptional MerR regulator [Kitasatospora sp. MAP12-15]|uniref:MerR family transcriptional regulator n=1 Tax=unclassified Kitasatospora TaxID=2633591 RepID=UPI002476C489|nr:MerR family transcriptional regulator [Kitasatospora sp. MAP12-44]MDH6113447.1 DNA-binding transcriptional MerR regulator [Kitasatospora sp. MAP12-44]
MRLSELSARSGVPTATIKYYLREGLLPPGERVSASRSDYGEAHLRRLRLVRSLIQVGGMSVAGTKGVLQAAEDDSLDQHEQFGAAQRALLEEQGPQAVPPEPGEHAQETVDELLEELGWERCHNAPAYWMLVGAVASLERLGYPCDLAQLRPYAAAVLPVARFDLEVVSGYPAGDERLEAVVALTVLKEPVLLALRRIAHTYLSGANS